MSKTSKAQMHAANQHRARKAIEVVAREYPWFNKETGKLAVQCGRNWPKWCLIPTEEFFKLLKVHGHRSTEHLMEIPRLAALGQFRFSQGVYRFDQTLFRELTETDISGPMPAKVLMRLPEWCFYVETPGCEYNGDVLHGIYVHLDPEDRNGGTVDLRLLLDTPCKGFVPIWIPLGPWTVEEALQKVAERAAESAQVMLGGEDLRQRFSKVADEVSRSIKPFISLLLYICGEEPEIEHRTLPELKPIRPRARRVGSEWRIMPPARVHEWDVGKKMGETLRALREHLAASEPTGRTVTPHIRRAHWHGFWKGPKDGERIFTHRWIPALPVGFRSQAEEPQ